ncbi:MAG: serine kinase, partial [Mesorhizobium sp.]
MNLPIAPLARPEPQTAAASGRVRRFYRAYGLVIGSEVALPELEPTRPATPDLEIAVGRVDLPGQASRDATAFRFEPTRQYLSWQAVGTFLI